MTDLSAVPGRAGAPSPQVDDEPAGETGRKPLGARRHKAHRLLTIILVAFGLGMMAGSARAQNAENKLGNWLIFNSTISFSDRWSLFTEAQVRLYEPVSNLNELLARAAAHYNFTPDVMVGLGYLRADSWPFEDGSRDRIENRLYQQFALWLSWDRTRFEHRYRLEQRWLRAAGGDPLFHPGALPVAGHDAAQP